MLNCLSAIFNAFLSCNKTLALERKRALTKENAIPVVSLFAQCGKELSFF